MSTEAMKLALEALEPVSTFGRVGSRDVDTAKAREAITALQEALASEAIEQPTQRCPLCNYQHGHAIGCKNNPVDIALNKMAENARELGLDYEQPAPVREPVAWMQDSIELYVQDRPSEYYTIPLYTSPPAQRTWVGLSDLDIDKLENEYMKSAQTAHQFLRAIEAKLKEKNNGN